MSPLYTHTITPPRTIPEELHAWYTVQCSCGWKKIDVEGRTRAYRELAKHYLKEHCGGR